MVRCRESPVVRCQSRESSMVRSPSTEAVLLRCLSRETPLLRCHSEQLMVGMPDCHKERPVNAPITISAQGVHIPGRMEGGRVPERLQSMRERPGEALAEKLQSMDSKDWGERPGASEMRQRAAQRLQSMKGKGPELRIPKDTADASDMQARAAARLQVYGNTRKSLPNMRNGPKNNGSKRSRGRTIEPDSPGLPTEASFSSAQARWVVADEVVFDPIDLDADDAGCNVEWPAAAASTVGEAFQALSPRREHSPLRFMEPVLDQIEQAQRAIHSAAMNTCMSRSTRPARGPGTPQWR